MAGPGSGKTRVLVERFCWLVRERKVSPLRILAITFTEKAATEIKRRLAREFAGHPELREQVERAYVSTVHGFCARLLRENPIAAGVDPEFAVMDAPESDRELEEAAHEALDQKRFWPLLEAIYVSTWPGGRQADMAEAVIKIYEAMRTDGRTFAEVRRRAPRRQPVLAWRISSVNCAVCWRRRQPSARRSRASASTTCSNGASARRPRRTASDC